MSEEKTIDRSEVENLLKRRFFYDQSFSIYGGVNGLYDYGPVGCAIKSNILNQWRRHFILEEQMLEIDCSILTPEVVLKASGHVDRFDDFMLKDTQTGECFRADHLIENHLEKLLEIKEISDEKKSEMKRILPQIGNMNAAGLDQLVKQYHIKAPNTNNDLSEPIAFNLMFSTTIGATGQVKGYFRPEAAQGMFVNFKRLLEFNQGRLPFAAAQIGNAFRNEISPRSGLLRVREFTVAEIEHFVDPMDKTHPKYETVADLEIQLYSANNQANGESTQLVRLGDAVRSNVINNETLAYFIGRIYLFFTKIGIDKTRIRFRQHMSNEMAHYASDCWDVECKISYGWIECGACADRSSYDLNQHIRFSGQRLTATRQLSTAKTILVSEKKINSKAIGQSFRADASKVMQYLQNLSEHDARSLHEKLQQAHEKIAIDDKEFIVTTAMFTVETAENIVQVEEFIPCVIEPTFGIGRILYTMLEHNFKVRSQDEQRKYFTLPPSIAPYKCAILPLSGNAEFKPFTKQISDLLTQAGISYKVDTSSSCIGKRYARCDEIAIPFAVTVDFDTSLQPPSIAFRELNSMKQIRVPIDEIVSVVQRLSTEQTTWTKISTMYPMFTEQQNRKVENEEKTVNRTLSETNKCKKVDEQGMALRFHRKRERRNALSDLSATSTNSSTAYHQHHNQLVDRIRQLEEEVVVPDFNRPQRSPVYSPFTPVTPCSNSSSYGLSTYPSSMNFPMNLISPNGPVPTQSNGLSTKILERAHEIPERFWINWQEKQMQNRIEQLESIKDKLTISNEPQKKRVNQLRRQCHVTPPQTASFTRMSSATTDSEASSPVTNNRSLFSFDQRSINKVNENNRNRLKTSLPMKQNSQSTLDRSRLTIFLPHSYTHLPEKTTIANKNARSITKSSAEKTNDIKQNSIQRIPSTNSVEDIAQIDTEFNLTLLVRENRDQTNPLLYSKMILNRTVEFQSLSSKKNPSK
ncbi:unnamed protein product [Rotaria socialis]|uniref:glycine--tRNA ligase n=2 Tax=Rotaria socialis TaxID=392032 RepID=A0A820IL33_9BILA|nr:unnamed protein product [Rotaria socialis]